MQFKNKTIRNISFVIVFVILSLLVIMFNYFVDPYGVRDKTLSKEQYIRIDNLPKKIIYSYLDKTNDKKFDVVLLGSSCISGIFSPVSFSSHIQKKVASLVYPAITIEEIYLLLSHFLNIHPEVKQVYIAIDMNMWFLNPEDNYVKIQNSNSVRKFFYLYYSSDTSILSINKLGLFGMLEKDEKVVNGYIVNKRRKYEYTRDFSVYKMQVDKNSMFLNKIKQLLDSKNVEGIFIIPPVHSLFLSYYYNMGEFYKIQDMKRQFVQITPFYDMAYVNRYTVEPFEYLWHDVLHPLDTINEIIYDVIVNKNENSEIVFLLNYSNLEKNLKKQRMLLEKYIENNNSYVENYIGFDIKSEDTFKYDEFRKEFNIPKNIEELIEKTKRKNNI